MFEELTDAQLMEGARRGEEGYAAELIRRYRAEIYGYVLSRVKCPDSADEITQRTLMRMLRHLGRYDPRRASVRSWLFVLARSELLSFWERQNRHRTEDLDDVPEAELPSCEGPEDIHRRALTQQTVQELLMSLSPEERAPVALFWLEGLSKREIGRCLGLSEHAVRHRIACGMAHLRAEAARRGIESSRLT